MTRPRLALGTAQLGFDYGVANRAGRPDAAVAERILRTAADLGIDYIDTAATYGDAEEKIGTWLSTAGNPRVRVATKTTKLPGGLTPGEMKAAIEGTIDHSLRRLGVESLDTVLIHSTDDLRNYSSALVEVLEQYRDAHHIERLGVSIYDPEDVDIVLRHRSLTVTQFPFSVFNQVLVAQRSVERLRAAGHECVGRSALHQGLLTLEPELGERAVPGSGTWLERFRKVCTKHGKSPFEAALGYAVSSSGADYVIVGVDIPEQLNGLSEAFNRTVPEALAAEIHAAFKDVPDSIRDPRRRTPRPS